MTSKQSFYRHLDQVFSLPDYFGNNLDALWDVLNEEKEASCIIFLNSKQANKNLGAYSERLIDLLKQLAKENKNYRLYLYE